MSVDVSSAIVIHRPPDEVAEYASNPDHAPAWYENIESVEWVTSPPVEVGSRIEFVARFLRRRLGYTYEVVELVPRKRLVMRSDGSPFPMETTYTWEAVEGTTRMTLRNRGTPTGFSRLFAPFMSNAIRKANRKDLARLKALLEGRA